MTPWGTNVIFEVSSAGPTEDPVWVDLSDRVLDVGQALDIDEGRQSELVDVDPAGFTVQLRNRDDWLTPGNPSSPYVSWWKQGRRCRFRQIVGWLGYDEFDGHLEIPENLVKTQDPNASDSDILLTVTGIDLVGWHRDGRKMSGTLAEHIVYHGGSALKAYWPLNEAGLPIQTERTDPWTLETASTRQGAGSHPNDPETPSIQFAEAAPAPGDDTNGVTFQPSRDTTIPVIGDSIELVGVRDTVITVGAGQVVTLVAWINPDEQMAGINSPVPVWLNHLDADGDPLADGLSAAIGWDAGVFYGSGGSGADWGGIVDGPMVPYDIWIPVAVRLGYSPATLELWVGAGVYTDTMTVTTPDDADFSHMRIGRAYDGSLSDVQVYVGAPEDWDHDDFLAQHQMGLLGADRQLTGARINMIADYAGVPASQRDIDPGTSVMRRAEIAGKTAAQLWDEARDTEQGRLFAHGGRLVFHDRSRIYNV